MLGCVSMADPDGGSAVGHKSCASVLVSEGSASAACALRFCPALGWTVSDDASGIRAAVAGPADSDGSGASSTSLQIRTPMPQRVQSTSVITRRITLELPVGCEDGGLAMCVRVAHRVCACQPGCLRALVVTWQALRALAWRAQL